MKQDTKQEILNTARTLFNQRGYNDVSTRDISEAMGISKGNLTYHFKKKEDLLEAVVREMHSQYQKPSPPRSLMELDSLFIHVQEVAVRNAFYFWHYTQLAQLSDYIRDIQRKVTANLHAIFAETFGALNKDGFLCDEEYPGQYRHLIHALEMSCVYWTPYAKLLESDETGNEFLSCMWGILYPILTDRGKQIYREQIGKRREKNS